VTFAQMANVQTVGIGLYLALAVIQAVSTTGVAGLVRRISTLRTAVTSSSLKSEVANIRRLSGAVSGLEMAFQHLGRRLLTAASVLFTISVAYFSYATNFQNVDTLQSGKWFIFMFYLALPILLFFSTTAIIAVRCRAVAHKIELAERRILPTLLDI
jgi:hypothetical protein